MNKYKEAFERIFGTFDYIESLLTEDDRCLNVVTVIINKKDYLTLKELVEKATPKKPIQLENKDRHKCPSCGSQLPFKKNALKKKIICCNKCTQTIDWSE